MLLLPGSDGVYATHPKGGQGCGLAPSPRPCLGRCVKSFQQVLPTTGLGLGLGQLSLLHQDTQARDGGEVYQALAYALAPSLAHTSTTRDASMSTPRSGLAAGRVRVPLG